MREVLWGARGPGAAFGEPVAADAAPLGEEPTVVFVLTGFFLEGAASVWLAAYMADAMAPIFCYG